jgi:hypothetical protein
LCTYKWVAMGTALAEMVNYQLLLSCWDKAYLLCVMVMEITNGRAIQELSPELCYGEQLDAIS